MELDRVATTSYCHSISTFVNLVRAGRLITTSYTHNSPLPQRLTIIPDRLPDHARIGLRVMGLEHMGGITHNFGAYLGRHTQAVKEVGAGVASHVKGQPLFPFKAVGDFFQME